MQSEDGRSYSILNGIIHNMLKHKKLMLWLLWSIIICTGFSLASYFGASLLLKYSGRIAGFFGAEKAAQILIQLEECKLWTRPGLCVTVGIIYGVIVFTKKKACIAIGIPLFIIVTALAILMSYCNGIGTWDVLKYLISVM